MYLFPAFASGTVPINYIAPLFKYAEYTVDDGQYNWQLLQHFRKRFSFGSSKIEYRDTGPSDSIGVSLKTENVFRVCIAWYKHERGWENSRQLCKPETKSRVCITVENSPNASSVYIMLCKHRKKVFYCFYKINFTRKDAKLFLWHWLKEKFLPVAKSCALSLARVVSSCFAKGCFPKYGLFSLKMSA